jgi:hypothetical protein
VLAGLIGRTPDWLSKVENNQIALDRLKVFKLLAEALNVSVGDLVGEPTLFVQSSSARTVVPALRAALMNPIHLTPHLHSSDPQPLIHLEKQVSATCDAYQASQYGYVASVLPNLLGDTLVAARAYEGDDGRHANVLLALSYQAATSVLIKVGEADLAYTAAERGLAAASRSGDDAVAGSLIRSVAFNLAAIGSLNEAVTLTDMWAERLRPRIAEADDALLSVYGTLLLAGSMAAARGGDRAAVQHYLAEAEATARTLGRDKNILWTAFGPTNVAMHRVSTAMELGDVQLALWLGSEIDTSSMPAERRVRHRLDLAHALNRTGQRDKAMSAIVASERIAPEQVHSHHISRALVLGWVRTSSSPPVQLGQLAARMHLAGQST